MEPPLLQLPRPDLFHLWREAPVKFLQSPMVHLIAGGVNMDAANIFRRLLIQNLDQEEGRFLGFVHSVQIDPRAWQPVQSQSGCNMPDCR